MNYAFLKKQLSLPIKTYGYRDELQNYSANKWKKT